MVAAQRGLFFIVQALIQAGADPNWPDKEDGSTPLITAVREGLLSMSSLLVRMRADLDQRDYDGWSVWHHCCSEGHLHILEALRSNAICVDGNF